jgi:dTDP-4-dehydrorhamnose reductase
MKILLIGNTGQLGWELERALQPLGPVVAVDLPEINMADPTSIRNIVHEHYPQVIFNASAYTAVDKAESVPELAAAVNHIGPGVLAEEAKKINAALVHYSTDYVFDGKKGESYLETDRPNPLNVYGRSKFDGEQAIQEAGGRYLIFRTAWVYSLRSESFVSKVLGWSRKQEALRVVNDQISNPTWAHSLAEISARVLALAGEDFHQWLENRSGLYHIAGDGYASRFTWAKKILKYDPNPQEQVIRELIPAASTEFPTPAARPSFSALDCTKFKHTFGMQLPPWEQTLAVAMNEGLITNVKVNKI